MISWLQRNRTSSRVAFSLRLFVMAANGVLGLFWARMLLRAMGDGLMGQFLAFQAVASLGGLSDLGMGGAVALRAGQMLGSGDEPRLRVFLANARPLFFALGITVSLVFLILSGWLPGWLHFEPVAGAGSYHLLFVAGAASAGFFIINSYFQNVNYACGTVVWPILPLFLLAQFSVLAHWCLARGGFPLWVQYLPYLAAMPVTLVLGKAMLDWAHPWIGNLFPLRIDWPAWKSLLSASGWVYLCSLGNMIYVTTDRLVINAHFGPARLPAYQYNYKLCDLAVTLTSAAAFVTMPKITHWLASTDPATRARGAQQTSRLNQFQIIFGCAAALFYLAVNDLFVTVWLGAKYQVPIALQAAFALNLAITASADASIQVTGRCGVNGVRTAGLAIAGTGLLNLALSLLSAHRGSIVGVAVATVIAQSVLSVLLSIYLCRHLELPIGRWIARSWLLPLIVMAAAIALKSWLPDQAPAHVAVLLGCYAALILAIAALSGFTIAMLKSELATVRSILGR